MITIRHVHSNNIHEQVEFGKDPDIDGDISELNTRRCNMVSCQSALAEVDSLGRAPLVFPSFYPLSFTVLASGTRTLGTWLLCVSFFLMHIQQTWLL